MDNLSIIILVLVIYILKRIDIHPQGISTVFYTAKSIISLQQVIIGFWDG